MGEDLITPELENKCLDLICSSKIMMLSNIDENEYPAVRSMLNLKNKGLKKFRATTNTSSKKVKQIGDGTKASLYFVDGSKFLGLTLFGIVKILNDEDSKKMLWQDGFEMYYPLGVNDPDYSVVYFEAFSGEFYHNLSVSEFRI